MEEIWLSPSSFQYLLSIDFTFCRGCPMSKYHRGYLDSITGDVECTRDNEHVRSQFILLLKTLEKIDQIAELERKIPIYINYYRQK